MNHTIDTDYLFLATRVSALERSMLSHERIERMLEAATVEDAAKVLVECKYPELEHVTLSIRTGKRSHRRFPCQIRLSQRQGPAEERGSGHRCQQPSLGFGAGPGRRFGRTGPFFGTGRSAWLPVREHRPGQRYLRQHPEPPAGRFPAGSGLLQ